MKKTNTNDFYWILCFLIFLCFDNKPELMKLITSNNINEDYDKLLDTIKNTDSDMLKQDLIKMIKDKRKEIKDINNAYLSKNITPGYDPTLRIF